jgi:hypothetical protein
MINNKKLSSQSMSAPQPKKKCMTSDANKGKRILQAVSLTNSFEISKRFRPDNQKKLEDPSVVFLPKDQSAFLMESNKCYPSLQLQTLPVRGQQHCCGDPSEVSSCLVT